MEGDFDGGRVPSVSWTQAAGDMICVPGSRTEAVCPECPFSATSFHPHDDL